jgi:hypothetical protein
VNKWGNIIRILGIATCLIGAYLMAFGEPIIGINHAGISTVVGIIGIGLISTGNSIAIARHKKKAEIKK